MFPESTLYPRWDVDDSFTLMHDLHFCLVQVRGCKPTSVSELAECHSASVAESALGRPH